VTQLNERLTGPYGTWSSPITAEMVATAGRGLSAPWLESGTSWWLEGRPAEAGRVVVMRADPGSDPVDVTPEGFNVRSSVHEYGGGAYCVHREVAFFSNFDDQRLYRQDPGEAPAPISPDIPDRRHRYADGRVTSDGALWIGVRERHDEGDRPQDVVNELVALSTDGSGEPWTIAGGRDFYAAPRISPDGTRLCFLAWDLPWMPWDGCELFVADLAPDGTLADVEHVAGRDGEESIFQPEWSPEGDLVFVSDRSGWWNLERIRDGEHSGLHEADAEFGYPAWTLGSRSFGFLGDGRIACVYDTGGSTHFAILDPETGDLRPLGVPHDALWSAPHVVAEGSTVVFIGGSPTIPNQVVRVETETGAIDVLRSSAEVPVDTSFFSVPRPIEFPTEAGLTAYAHYYPPTNPRHVADADELPPLIVECHGGPTSSATPIFALSTQFWTSRGFAVVDVDYGGSTGYGRAYRERLNGQWGVVDVADSVNAARHLARQGEVDQARLFIRGGSAGGYTAICAVTFTDDFAGAVSYFGLANLEQFAGGETHKFELQYDHTLVGRYPEELDLYRERSPINYVERIETPMLVLQGADDEIVPPAHAEVIVDALRERGIPYAYLLFEGEGHGFRKSENIAASLEAELSFYCQVLGLEPGDPIPTLDIENL
jgi:dipeptidyl aminopeptidase/acylaminoacyl peptidase